MEGFDITGIDIVDAQVKLGYKHKFIQADILTLKGEDFRGFDVIWGSPPCRDFSTQTQANKGYPNRKPPNPEEGLKLIQCFRNFVKDAQPKIWLMENVQRLELFYPEKPILHFYVSKQGHRSLWGNINLPMMPDLRFNRNMEFDYLKLSYAQRSAARAMIPLACSQAFAKACKEELFKQNHVHVIPNMPSISFDKIVDWNAFEEYLLKNHNVRVARDYVSYAQKWEDCLRNGDLSKVLVLSPGRRRMVMASLAALAKFLGVYKDWQQLTERYSLKWAGRSSTDIILERFQKVEDPNEIFNWIKQVKQERPELTDFMDLMAITGMRMIEAFNCYNMIIQLSKEGRIAEYYKDQILEHYKFKDVFIRGNKKIFISFVPEQLINRIAKNEPLNSWMSVQKLVTKRGLPSRFSDVREAHATFLTKFLKDAEIDFLHGRVSTNVFMRNYFNPALIVDLSTRVFQAIQEIQEKIA
jgi:intergrase/recombinase